MTDLDVDRLRELALKANPSLWHGELPSPTERLHAFIVAANPSAILALIAAYEQARDERDAAESKLRAYDLMSRAEARGKA